MLLDLVGWIDKQTLLRRGFESRTIATSVGNLHVFDGAGSGDLPPILVFHGINSRASNYHQVLSLLLRRCRRVIAPDLPAHGLSDRPATVDPEMMRRGMSELLDQVVDEPMIVVGNSLGGVSGIRFAQERPELVSGLFLSSPGGARQSAEELQDFLSVFKFESTSDAAHFLDRIHLHPPWYRRLVARSVYRMFTEPPMKQFIENLSTDDLITPEDLAQLTMPLLMIWGRGDRLLPLQHYKFYCDHLPKHAIIEDPPDFSHCPYQDRPDELAARILHFAEHLR